MSLLWVQSVAGSQWSEFLDFFKNNFQKVPFKAKLLLLKIIHLFAREVFLVKKLEIEEIKTT